MPFPERPHGSTATAAEDSGAEGQTRGANPFIGSNTLTKVDSSIPAGDVPGITLELGNKEVTGSFLLDTGASASVISKDLAAKLGVRERAGGGPGDRLCCSASRCSAGGCGGRAGADARLQPEVGLLHLLERAQRRLRQRSERLPRQRLVEVRKLRQSED